jgi:hypothetical protein
VYVPAKLGRGCDGLGLAPQRPAPTELSRLLVASVELMPAWRQREKGSSNPFGLGAVWRVMHRWMRCQRVQRLRHP